MNIKIITLLLCLLLVWTACKKKKTQTQAPKQYSTWIVNNHDTFRTNNVDSSVDCNPDHSYCVAGLMSHDSLNWFSLAFNTDYFPTSGTYEFSSPAGIKAVIKLYYHNVYYYPKPLTVNSLSASMQNDKVNYTMPVCWFVNHDNSNDSILVQGTFNLP